jgi:formylglycine-generating enzyme required for sulfatase activity
MMKRLLVAITALMSIFITSGCNGDNHSYPYLKNPLPNDLIPKMIKMEGGEFRMGTDRPQNRVEVLKASPSHLVTLSPYYFSETVVPYKLFKLFITETKYQYYTGKNEYWGPIEDHIDGDMSPVFDLNWHEALLFCNWLSRKMGLTPVYTVDEKSITREDKDFGVKWNRKANGFRLATEAEWEYAALAKGTMPVDYPGDKWLPLPENFKHPAVTIGYKNRLGVVVYLNMETREWLWSTNGLYSGKPLVNPEGPDKDIDRKGRRTRYLTDGGYYAPLDGFLGGGGEFITIRLARNANEH